MNNERRELAARILTSMVAGSRLEMTYKSPKTLDEMVDAAVYLAEKLMEKVKPEPTSFPDGCGEVFDQLTASANSLPRSDRSPSVDIYQGLGGSKGFVETENE
jgi:hypothetical protein